MGSAPAGRGGEHAAAGDRRSRRDLPMDLHWLKPLLGRPSPFTTVYLDATRTGANADAEAADRWRAVRRSLERDGAPAGVLDDIAELVSRPDRRARPARPGRSWRTPTASSSTGCSPSRRPSRTPCSDPAPALLPGGARGRRDGDATCWSRWTATVRTSPGRPAAPSGPRAARRPRPSTAGTTTCTRRVRVAWTGAARRARRTPGGATPRRSRAVLDKRVAERGPDLVLHHGRRARGRARAGGGRAAHARSCSSTCPGAVAARA